MLQQHVHIKFANPSKCSRASQGNEGALSDTGVFSCEGKKERKRFWPAAAFAGHNIVRKDLFLLFQIAPAPRSGPNDGAHEGIWHVGCSRFACTVVPEPDPEVISLERKVRDVRSRTSPRHEQAFKVA